MTDPEITTLARGYAEWVTNVPKAKELPNCLLNEANTLIADDAERILQWLLRRFCLVEKSKVEDAYKRAKNTEKDGEDLKLPLLCRTGRVQRILLESLFPEIGKEMGGDEQRF